MLMKSGCTRVGMVLAAALFVTGCGGGGSMSASAPAAGTATSPTSAITAPGKATLSWTAPIENTDGTALTNLSGYKIYYGMTQNNLDSYQTIPNASVTAFIVENLTVGTWFFAVAAVNSQGMESAISNIASKTIS